MSRKHYRYSLDRRDAKLAGVCSYLGDRMGVDPTFVRIGFVGIPLLTPMTFVQALVVYSVVGIFLALQRARGSAGERHMSDFERMDFASKRKPTVHAKRTELDEKDRRMMAIDHHLSKQNDELAREIEALREEK
jgi:phage shock protein PspC (stress-responsive transcriptional regulator)